jgi:hypothetical protein
LDVVDIEKKNEQVAERRSSGLVKNQTWGVGDGTILLLPASSRWGIYPGLAQVWQHRAAGGRK